MSMSMSLPQGVITKGQRHVFVDLSDVKYATSNGRTSSPDKLTHMKWGIAADCRGAPQFESRFRLNLEGTPFQVESTQPVLPLGGLSAHGGASCEGKRCYGQCGGECGWCGFGFDYSTRLVKLEVHAHNPRPLFNQFFQKSPLREGKLDHGVHGAAFWGVIRVYYPKV